MEKITTKSGKETMMYHYNMWKRSTDSELGHVYGRFSSAKVSAMEYCRNLMNEYNGEGLKIISFNDQMFTVGFEFPHPETGVLCFAYITKAHDRYIEL